MAEDFQVISKPKRRGEWARAINKAIEINDDEAVFIPANGRHLHVMQVCVNSAARRRGIAIHTRKLDGGIAIWVDK